MSDMSPWHFTAQVLILVGAVTTVIGLIRSLAKGDGRLAALFAAMKGLVANPIRRLRARSHEPAPMPVSGAAFSGSGTLTAEGYVTHNPPDLALTMEERVKRLEDINIADSLNHNADLQEVRAKLRDERETHQRDMQAASDRLAQVEVEVENRLRAIASDGVGLAAWGAALTVFGVAVDFVSGLLGA